MDGGLLRLVVHHGPIPSTPVGEDTLPLVRGVATGRAILERRTIHVANLQAETIEYPQGSGRAQHVGALILRRKRAGGFTAETVARLQAFANLRIASENARLFEESAQKSRELEGSAPEGGVAPQA